MLSSYFRRDWITVWRPTGYTDSNPYESSFTRLSPILARYKLGAVTQSVDIERETSTTDQYVVKFSGIKQGDFIAAGKHSDLTPVEGARRVRSITRAIFNNDYMIVAGD